MVRQGGVSMGVFVSGKLKMLITGVDREELVFGRVRRCVTWGVRLVWSEARGVESV